MIRQEHPRKGTAVRKTYQNGTTTAKSVEQVMLPESVTVAVGELAGQLREGLLAMAVGAGLQAAQVLMAESGTALCGPQGKHDPTRTAVRHGSERGSMTLGGRRVPAAGPDSRRDERAAGARLRA